MATCFALQAHAQAQSTVPAPSQPPKAAFPANSPPTPPTEVGESDAPPTEATEVAPATAAPATPAVQAPATNVDAPYVAPAPIAGPPPFAPDAPPERRWYGWQTLLVDIPSLALWIGGAAARPQSNGTALGVGFAGFMLGAPIVHAAHGHWGKFGASLGFRAGTVLVGVVGAFGCINDTLFTDRNCGAGYQALLVVGSLGILAAVAVDAAFIAREDVKPERHGGIGVGAWVAERGRGGGLSLGGAL